MKFFDYTKIVFGISLLTFIAAISAGAQQSSGSGSSEAETFSAERPGFTNGTETVPPHRLQGEYGYRYTGGKGGSHEHDVGDGAQLRYGITPRFEARLGLPSYSWQRGSSGGQSAAGFDDSFITAKWRFHEEACGGPSLAFIAGTSLPTGASSVGEHYFQPQIALEAGRTLSPLWNIEANFTYQSARSEGTRFDQYGSGVCVNYTLSPAAGVFLEVYRQSASGSQGPTANYADTGVTYQLNKTTQIDINGGVGLTRNVHSEFFVSAGIARRW